MLFFFFFGLLDNYVLGVVEACSEVNLFETPLFSGCFQPSVHCFLPGYVFIHFLI